jgi:type I restriction enzyme M protein
VKTGVLVFRRHLSIENRKLTIENGKVWFYEIRADGFDPDKISGGGRPETPERNDIPGLLSQWKEYKNSKFADPPGVQAGTLLPAGTDDLRCWWATMNTVAENDYNLAAGRYKPQISEPPPQEDPAELIRETLAIERDITGGLEQLLKDLEMVR